MPEKATHGCPHRALLLFSLVAALPACGSPERPVDRASQVPLILEQVLRYEVQQLAGAAADHGGVSVCLAVRDGDRPSDPGADTMTALGGRDHVRPQSACPEGESIRLVAGPIEWLHDDEARVKGEYRRDPGDTARPLAYRVVREDGVWRCAGPIVSSDPL